MNSRENAQPASEALRAALSEEARSRASSLLSGILRYMDTPYRRNVAEPPCIWQRGNARVLDYGNRGTWNVKRGSMPATYHAPPATILFIPSLINRYYILDLDKERSFLRFLAGQGFYPLALDWGEPGPHEHSFGIAEYIVHILLPAIDFIVQSAGQPVALAGYCMGGNLALAAAQLRRKDISSLALLATPWDFHCREFSSFVLDHAWLPMVEALLSQHALLPADVVQSLFYLTDPFIFEQKFRRFAGLAPHSRAAKEFLALEHWVNDGVPLTAQVARDCLLGWAQKNCMAKGQWRVAGRVINPARINIPTFIAIPRNDHIVPRSCAQPLADALPQAHIIRPSAGHVSMIVGNRAKKELWQPLAEWLAQL